MTDAVGIHSFVSPNLLGMGGLSYGNVTGDRSFSSSCICSDMCTHLILIRTAKRLVLRLSSQGAQVST